MKKNFIFSFILFSTVTVIGSCASIIHGSKQTVEFASRPVGAKLFLDGKEMGTTPQTIDLKRKGRTKDQEPGKKSYAVKIEMDGYQPYETTLKRKLDGWVFGNLIIGGLLGIVIDAASGAIYKLSPKRVDGDFLNSSADIKSGNDGIYLTVTLKPDPGWEKIGEMTKVSK